MRVALAVALAVLVPACATPCPAPADFAALPAGVEPAFLVRGRTGGTNQLVLLDGAGSPIAVGGAGAESIVWARTSTPLTGTTLPPLGSDFALARGGTLGGAVLLLRAGATGAVEIATPSGDRGVAAASAVVPSDAAVAIGPSGERTLFLAAGSTLAAFSRDAGGDVVPVGTVGGLGGDPVAVLAIPADDEAEPGVVVVLVAPASGAASVAVLDLRTRSVVQRALLDATLSGCRYLAAVPRSMISVPGETQVAVGCTGNARLPGMRVGAGYAMLTVPQAPASAPRVLRFALATDVAAPAVDSPIVAMPGGAIVYAGAGEAGTSVVSVDLLSRSATALASLATVPPEGEALGAGAYDAGARVLVWPDPASNFLYRWSVPEGSFAPIGRTTFRVTGCAIAPIWEAISLGAAPPLPGVDAGTADAGGVPDAGSEPDAPELDAATADAP